MTRLVNQFIIMILVGFSILSCATNDKQKPLHTKGQITYIEYPTNFVNPFLGTAPLIDSEFIGYTPPKGWRVWAGLTYPGSTLPNAMVQVSPITQYGSGAGYEYEDSEIIGFTHTNKGHWNLCNIPILPVSGEATFPFKSSFNKQSEKASPAYYEVNLSDYNVKVRVTSTMRAGVHEYTFDDGSAHKILFDLGRSNNHVNDWQISQSGDQEVEGFQQIGKDKIYFFAKLSENIQKINTIKSGESEGYSLLTLQAKKVPVILKIGLSFVSTANAKENLKEEVGDQSFETIYKKGIDTWEKVLSKIQVSGGTQQQNELFYSSLYRSMQWPALRSDCNGDFTDNEGNKQNKGFRYYTVPSLWDTYRNKLVLLSLLSPDVTGDIIQSLVDRGELTGFMPTFFHGDHAASFIASAYGKGIKNFDVKKAYELLLNNAYKEDGTRPFISEYIEKGFISDPDVKNPNTETKAKAGVSKTLEFAHDDYSLSLFATQMGDDEHAEDLMKRSKNYKNVFDSKTHFMRGRLENGDWITPFNPQYPYYEYMYREANAWQVSFYVPHDMPGLVALYDTKEQFEQKLDSLFTLRWDANHIARNVSSFIGQYCQGNQPDHEAPFAYYFVNKPEKSQKIIDTILSYYYGVGEGRLALSGMDDAGEMSAWYVFAASGLYPLSPGDNKYLVSIPLFKNVKWNLNNSFCIQQDSKSRNLKNIQYNRKNVDGYFITQNQFANGGELIIKTK